VYAITFDKTKTFIKLPAAKPELYATALSICPSVRLSVASLLPATRTAESGESNMLGKRLSLV